MQWRSLTDLETIDAHSPLIECIVRAPAVQGILRDRQGLSRVSVLLRFVEDHLQ